MLINVYILNTGGRYIIITGDENEQSSNLYNFS